MQELAKILVRRENMIARNDYLQIIVRKVHSFRGGMDSTFIL